MAERFLILGASSFYGSNFAEVVRKKGDEAICLSRPGFDINGDWALDRSALDGAYVVNFISQSLVAESWDHPDEWMRTNALSTTKLFDKLKAVGIRKFVHVSTPEVYGSTPGWVEEDYTEWKPSTPYAVSRAAGDMMLMAYWRACQFPAVITRTANIYGPGQPEHRIIPKAIACKRAAKVLPLEGDGASLRSFIHVRDACEATYLIAKRGEFGETYHISGDRSYSIKQVVQKIGCMYKPAPDRLGKDQAYLLDSSRLRAMGWQDKINLEEGLRECESSI